MNEIPEGPDGEPDFVDAEGAVDAAAARAAVEQREADAVAAYEAETGIIYDTDSAVLQAAKLQDARDADALALSEAQDAVVEAQAAVDAIEGLQAKIDNAEALAAAAEAAADAATAAADAQVEAFADAEAAVTKYEINAGTELVINSVVDGNYSAIGQEVASVGALIETSETTGLLVLADGVTEETNPGITAVLNALKAYNAAVVASDDADTAANEAAIAADEANLANVLAAAQDEVDTLAAVYTVVAGDDATALEELTAVNAIEGLIATAEDNAVSGADYTAILATIDADIDATVLTDSVGDGSGADTTVASFTAAMEAYQATDGTAELSDAHVAAIVSAFTTAYEADGGTLGLAIAAAVDALTENNYAFDLSELNDAIDARDVADAENTAAVELATAEQAVVDAQDAITDLDDAIAELEAAEAMSAELASLDDAIEAAETALTDEGYVLPVVLADDADAVVTGTADADIYMITGLNDDSTDLTINSFAGDDTIYIGTEYTYNAGVYADDGDNSVLEVFVTEFGGEAVVVFETSEFGSNAATPEDFQITLTGVAAADVTIADGFITVA